MKKFLIGIVFLICFVVLWYQSAYPSYSWNQKVTMTVQTPNGIVSASSVGRTELAEGIDFGISGVGNFKNEFEGEAVVLVLPNGQFLFSLITGANSFSWRAFSDVPGVRKKADGSYAQWDESAKQIQKLKGAKAFPPEHYPMLVTFGDMNDPAFVKEVNPNNLVASFGEGYSLKSITLEITDEVMTEGEVKKVLTWIVSHKLRLKPPSLRLGGGLHAASDILPEEKLSKLDFIRNRK